MPFHRILIVLAAGPLAVSAFASTLTVSETIGSQQGPWLYTNGGLNTSYQYGIGDQSAPDVISAVNGFDFSAGNVFAVQYVSGTTSAGASYAFVDAGGNHAFPIDAGPGSSGRPAPSGFMPPATFPIYLSQLVGAFANSSGQIVGTPFSVGDRAAGLIVPVGATQLQLGINDDIYSDNDGSLVVRVTGPSSTSTTPEPSTAGLIFLDAAALAALICRRSGRSC